jgi:hypothetical protein
MANEIENKETTIDVSVEQATASQKLDEKAKKQSRKKARRIVFKILLIVTILFLVNVYIILSFMYKGENFTVTLDSEYGRESGLIIYENKNESEKWSNFLRSDDIEFFTDISVDWLPKDIDNEGDGSHNGRNYIAYTFYAENRGQDTINYWASIEIEDVIKDVDEAIRIMVFKNGNKVTYAKNNRQTGQPEPNTVPFHDEDTVMLEVAENFRVGDVDKYTVVIWIEGDDPECKNNLIGGEIKMHMTLIEEHILQEDERP